MANSSLARRIFDLYLSSAKTFEKGQALHRAGKHFEAIQIWRRVHTHSDPRSAFAIGFAYLKGEGVIRNLPDAAAWLRKAAAAGHVEAQYEVGRLLLYGYKASAESDHAARWFGRPQERRKERASTRDLLFPNGFDINRDLAKARMHLEAAAEAGKPEAQAEVGWLCAHGPEEQRDFCAAHRWYLLAAECSSVKALTGLGILNEKGWGCTKQPQKAAAYYGRAVELGDTGAKVALAQLIERSGGELGTSSEMFALYLSAAEERHPAAMHRVGLYYARGEAGQRDIERAEYYLRSAANKGHVPSAIALGEFFSHGNGRSPDFREAARWYRVAAEAGDETAQFILGSFHVRGEGVRRSVRDAVKWFAESASKGHSAAAFNLAMLYSKGEGVERNPARSVELYHLAAERGVTAAKVKLGLLYLVGDGVPQSDERAAELFKEAASEDLEAKTSLAVLYLHGRGVLQDETIGEALLTEAAEAGYGPACLRIAQLHAKRGSNSPSSEPERWFLAAAEQGLAEAQLVVSRMYLRGHKMERNADLAISWLRRAASQGLAQAEFELGMACRRGVVSDPDEAEARRWFTLAAKQGHASATAALAENSQS